MAQLAAQGMETTTIQVYPALSNAAKKEVMLAEIAAADLVVLAFPLYVDTLPAPVIALLESLTARRAVLPPSTRFAALVNCGFPERTTTRMPWRSAPNFPARLVCAGWAAWRSVRGKVWCTVCR
jgi:hypothetical protein